MAQPMISVEQLHKSFGDTHAVAGVSFRVPPGRVVGLLGPNGAGKTTVINCLTTLLRPDSGTVLVAGFDVVRDAARVRQSVAVTGQFAALDAMLTGRENLVFFGRLLGLRRRAAGSRADELLERFGLGDIASKPVRTCSGGQHRRLDLAVSLMVPRPVLVLDEPTTGLDPRSRHALWQVVRELRDAGTTVLLTTQYLEEADQLADELHMIDRGRVIASGRPQQLKQGLRGPVCEIRIDDPQVRARAFAALRPRFPCVTETDGVIHVADADTAILAAILERLAQVDATPDDLTMRRPTLDEVFLALTGGARGDDPAASSDGPTAGLVRQPDTGGPAETRPAAVAEART